MINLTLHVNKVFIEQVEKWLIATFHQNTMEDIKNVMIKKDTCVVALMMFYDTKTNNPIKVYKVLSCVLYYVIDNCVYI